MKHIQLTAIILALTSPVSALETGAEFLRLDTGARAVALGSAYTAMTDGVNSIGYNPAGLTSVKAAEIGFTHTNWLLDSSHDFLGVAAPLKNSGLSIGIGVTRLSNSLEGRNADRSGGGGYGAYDQAVSLGLAGAAGAWRTGAAVKLIESSIAGEKATAVAVDLGVNRALGGRLPVSVGLAVRNLGTPLRYMTQKDPLPLTFAAGLMVPVVPGFNLSLDVRRLARDKQTAFSVGSEYAFMGGFALRTGYLNGDCPSGLKTRGLTMGAGAMFSGLQFDYSATPFGDLGNTQKFTLTKRF